MEGSAWPSTMVPISSLTESENGPRIVLHAAHLEPGGRRVDQRAADPHVVDGVEEAVKAAAIVVASEVLAIDLRRDAPHQLAVLVGREQRRLGVLEERVLARRQPVALLHVRAA